jgi:DNA-binding response OmpR family regulator
MRQRVLVVEDDAAQCRALQAVLEKARLAVVTAMGGQQALAYAEAGQVHLIILDIGLAGAIDGLQVLVRLKGSAATASTPVLMVSARAGEEWVAQAKAAGAAYCIAKPYDLTGLVDQVRRILAEHSERPGVVPTADGPTADRFTLDGHTGGGDT